MIPICGHTICSECILHLIPRSGDFLCPVGKERGNYSSLDSFPPNYTLRGLIEKSKEFELCKDHQKELQYMCIQDQLKICHECALFGGHRDHEITHLSNFKSEKQKNIEKLENLVYKTGKYQKNMKKLYEDQRKKANDGIFSKFQQLQFMLNVKKIELLHKANSFYDKEIEKLQDQIGENSLTRCTMTEIISGSQQSDNLLEPQKQDLQALFQTIQDAIRPDNFEKAEKLSKEMNLEIEKLLETQLSALENLNVPASIGNTSIKEEEKKTEKSLIPNSEIENQFIGPNPDIIVKGNQVVIKYPFMANISQDLDLLQLENPENFDQISTLRLVISQSIEGNNHQDVALLNYIRSKFRKIQSISIIIECQISDWTLFNIFLGVFWKNECLERIYIDNNEYGLYEQSLVFLGQNVLSKATNLKNFTFLFAQSEATSIGYDSISQGMAKIAGNLTNFQFFISCQDSKSLQNLFVSMPNLDIFGYFGATQANNDEVLMKFASNTLPSLKSLTKFQFLIENSSVTDTGIRKFLRSLPEEWFSNLTQFRMNVSGSGVSDTGLRDFVVDVLPRFRNLQIFDLFTEGSEVSIQMESRIIERKQECRESVEFISVNDLLAS